MNIPKACLFCLIVACLATSVPAVAMEFGAESFKLYGGVYSPDCGNPAAPRLRVLADALLVESAGKRMTGGKLEDAVSYFGPEPPPNYLTTLLSEVRGGLGLMFVVYRDPGGQYIELIGDRKVEAALGQVLGKNLKAKFRDCAPDTHKVNMPPPVQASSADNAWDPLRDAIFRRLYHRALGPKLKESWLARLDGPMSPVREIDVQGTTYRLVAVCKTHDCFDHSMVVLYSEARRLVYGMIYETGRTTLIGRPSPQLAADLERLWKHEWRQQ